MSPETNALPLRWFAATGLAVLLLAGVPLALLVQTIMGPKPPPAVASGGEPLPHKAPDPVEPRRPPPPVPRQLGEDGTVIAWGATVPGTSLRLEVLGVDRDQYGDVEFMIERDDAPAFTIRRGGHSAQLSKLEPGRYRWSARLAGRGDQAEALVEPPRGDSNGPNFVIAPPPVIAELRQSRLDGSAIAADRRTEGGARLAVQLQADYPGAVLEVEVKPAGSAFDAIDVLRAAASGGKAEFVFTAPDGSYRWRARATAAGRDNTAWRAFGESAVPDFIVFRKPPETKPNTDTTRPPPRQAKGPASQPPSALSRGSSGSRDLAGGRSDPLPSERQKLSSFWQIAFVRVAIGLAAVGATLAVLLFILRSIRHLTRRK